MNCSDFNNSIAGHPSMRQMAKTLLSHLGHPLSHQTVAHLLKRHGLEPAPERGKKTTWKDFIRSRTAP